MGRSLDFVRWAFIGLVFSLAACTTRPAETAHNAAPAAMPTTGTQVQSSILPGSAKDFRVNVGDTVHFDYARFDLRDEERSTLQRQATWLGKYPSVRATIEGHCDERGTRVYNLALGARRAEAVKRYLVNLGVPSARIDTICYGKERPVCAESTEMCWARNRRGVTVISTGASS